MLKKKGKNQMKRRQKIRKISFIFALLFTFSLVALTSFVKADRLEREKTAQIQQSICEFDEYVSSIDSLLSKGVYATTAPMISRLSTELWRMSSGAKTALSGIPNDSIDMSQANKFLSQLGEYVMSLDRKAARGEALEKKDTETLLSLLKYAKALHASASALRDGAFDGTVELIKKTGNISLNKNEEATELSLSLENTQKAVTDFPSLIYDGPFSDHLEKKTALFLNGKKEITQSQAKKKCAEYLSVDEKEIGLSSTVEGTVECFVFSCDKATCAVTKRGGYLCYIISSEYTGEDRLTYDEAKQKATEYLEKAGYKNMTDSYHSESDGICTINFAFESDGVKCYPDLIKVGVSMYDGAVLSVDARNYILSHRDRNLSEIGENIFSEAEKKVSELLKIKSARSAVIPTASGEEKLCCEFHCADGDGQEALVYIDSSTLEEADILLLMYADNGVLTK